MRFVSTICSMGLCLLLGVPIFGCGKGSAGPKTFAVSGTVTYNGQPVVGAVVAFYNQEPDGKAARGTTDANGKYELKTFLGGTNFKSGALPGEYVVLVTKDPATNVVTVPDEETFKSLSPEEQEKKAKEVMVGSMSKPGEQKQTSALASGEASAQSFRGSGPAETGIPSTLPAKYADTKTSDLRFTVKEGDNQIPLELKD